jgi:hypothetical protein
MTLRVGPAVALVWPEMVRVGDRVLHVGRLVEVTGVSRGTRTSYGQTFEFWYARGGRQGVMRVRADGGHYVAVEVPGE